MNKKLHFRWLLFFLILVTAQQYQSCKKVDLERVAFIKTGQVTEIATVTATASGEIVDLGEGYVRGYGIVCSQSGTPTIYDMKFAGFDAATIGIFEVYLTGLDQNTTYYIRSFIDVGDGVTYGEQKSFTTMNYATLPTVITDYVSLITSNTATCGGEVTDDGGATVTARGVCWSTSPTPTINDTKTINGNGIGTFTSQLTGLASQTNYYVRAYATNAVGTAYGDQKVFTTQQGTVLFEWLKYNDGTNYTGIGFNEGGSFDVAIRFTPTQLASYNGWKITKIKFFPKTGNPVSYSVEIFTGPSGSTTLEIIQSVTNPLIDQWNEVVLDVPYIIDASEELWVGYWIQNSPAATYPAGCDDGPAIAEYGDMISTDDGASWVSLSIAAPALDYNWNIEVYVTNQAGAEKKLNLQPESPATRKTNDNRNFNNLTPGSSINSSK